MTKYFVETIFSTVIMFTSEADLRTYLEDIPATEWPHNITMINDGTAITLTPQITLRTGN